MARYVGTGQDPRYPKGIVYDIPDDDENQQKDHEDLGWGKPVDEVQTETAVPLDHVIGPIQSDQGTHIVDVLGRNAASVSAGGGKEVKITAEDEHEEGAVAARNEAEKAAADALQPKDKSGSQPVKAGSKSE